MAGDQTELSQRKVEELGTAAENFLGIFGGRRSRRLSTSLSKHRLTEQAKADVEKSVDAIADYKKQLADLQAQRDAALAEVNAAWGDLANQISEIPVMPFKKDVLLDVFGVAWMPYHVVKMGEAMEELPGYTRRPIMNLHSIVFSRRAVFGRYPVPRPARSCQVRRIRSWHTCRLPRRSGTTCVKPKMSSVAWPKCVPSSPKSIRLRRCAACLDRAALLYIPGGNTYLAAAARFTPQAGYIHSGNASWMGCRWCLQRRNSVIRCGYFDLE